MFIIVLFGFFVLCSGHNEAVPQNQSNSSDIHIDISESTGNFSLELIYHTSKTQGKLNFVLSPIAVWTILAAVSEGALKNTRTELIGALRIIGRRAILRQDFQETARWLTVNTSTIMLKKLNVIILDKSRSVESDYQHISKTVYDTETVISDYADIKTRYMNISKTVCGNDLDDEDYANKTKCRLTKSVVGNDLSEDQMFLANSLHFKGQWAVGFNASYTTKQDFYDSDGVKLGRVNMMHNRHRYPYVRMQELQAKVIELPYGTENRLSMILLLPNPGVKIEDIFYKFQVVPLYKVFYNLKLAQENEDDVDCYIPRFKIESKLELSEILKRSMGISALFDPMKAYLGRMVRLPAYVKKFLHKVEIEVTEEGVTASGVTPYSANADVKRFEANRPFIYLIIEKVTNIIVIGGVYRQPQF